MSAINKYVRYISLIAVIFLAGCQDNKNSQMHRSLLAKIADLEQRLANAETNIALLKGNIALPVIKARRFILENDKGQPRAELAIAENGCGALYLSDTNGKRRILLDADFGIGVMNLDNTCVVALNAMQGLQILFGMSETNSNEYYGRVELNAFNGL